MPAPYTGGCQCGAVRYELTAEPLTVVACHCTECQKQSTSAFGMSVVVPAEALRLTRGEVKQWTRTTGSGRKLVANFCGTCGGRIFHQPDGVPIVTVRAGSLDDTSWLRPAGHLWTRSAQPWVTIDPDMLAYETQPEGGFGPLIDRYAERAARG
jgi:hypothetical protein